MPGTWRRRKEQTGYSFWDPVRVSENYSNYTEPGLIPDPGLDATFSSFDAWNPDTSATFEPRDTDHGRFLYSKNRTAGLLDPEDTATSEAATCRLSAWMKTCNQEHGDHCRTPRRHKLVGESFHTWNPDPYQVPYWLIDVYARCIAQAEPSDRYVALSYVWEAPAFRNSYIMLSKDTIEHLQKPGSLARQKVKIPRVILDAMELVASLGVRYLWVDRLCIVQDDETTKHHQINHMASIYADAYLTIVAAAGDALDPLEAISKQEDSDSCVSKRETREELLTASQWASRAWTLQELLHSRRAVFFLAGRMAWECHCDILEDTDQEQPDAQSSQKTCLNRFMGAGTGLQHTAWPDMHEYSDIVVDYTCRQLTFESDAVAAFLGVTNVLSKTFSGGFLFGLPAIFFDAALLWRPSAKIVRRDTAEESHALPSWSWMGWRFDSAPVDTTLWKAACSYVKTPRPSTRGKMKTSSRPTYWTSLTSTVTWFSATAEDCRQIKNDGLKWQKFPSLPGGIGPQGWKKHSDGFKHSSDPLTTFHYPIPAIDTSASTFYFGTPSVQPSTSSLLYFRTTRCYFKIGFYCTRGQSEDSTEHLAIAHIYDDEGKWAGHFRSHDMSLGLDSQNHNGDEALEFIAISEGCGRDGSHVFDMGFAKSHIDRRGMLKFVNVLWIEWVDGIAYRRGLGHIIKSAWERQAGEDIDVCLG